MEADDILRDKGKDAPRPQDMLQEAAWLNQQELGHPLNFMCSLYYETSDEPLPPEEGATMAPVPPPEPSGR